MKCEDFKKYMADLCDKQTDPAITEACRQHIKDCLLYTSDAADEL